MKENHKIPFSYDDEVVALIASRCTEVESGARAVDAILTNTVLPEIGHELLIRLMDGKAAKRVHVGIKENELNYAFE
jgi:type VI secretion system protein VasG